MTLADSIARATVPKARAEYGADGGTFDNVTSDTPLTDWSHIFEQFGLDPAQYEIVDDTVRCSTWQQSARTASGDRDVVQLYSYRASFRRRLASIDLPNLFSAVPPRDYRTARPAQPVTAVVCPSDEQVGKTDHRGGTPELIARAKAAQAAWDDYLKRVRPDETVIALGGDGIEGFESSGGKGGPKAYWSNDLSLAQQLDVYATMVHDWVAVTARHGVPVTVLAVPSNHGSWRAGGIDVGDPATDDLGLHAVRQAQKRFTDPNIEFVYPSPHHINVGHMTKGVRIALTHGEHCKPGREMQWAAAQARDLDSPFRDAAIKLTAHYHHFTVQQDGHALNGDGEKIPAWHLRLPTLDAGSTHYVNKYAGVDSDPGVLAFTVGERGLRLHDLMIL